MWSKADPNEKKLISYAGKLPLKLYRYRTVTSSNLDRIINFEIIEEGIYLAGLKDLNDPDEGRFLIKIQGSERDIFEYWKNAVKSTCPELTVSQIKSEARSLTHRVIQLDRIVPEHIITYTRYVLEHVLRVACFTTQPINYSMWANYAKFIHPSDGPIDHGGICIEYNCDEGWRSTTLHPVEYSDIIPEINVVTRDESELIKAVYKKSTEWRCEDEWRIVEILKAMPPFPDNLTVNSKMRLENGVSSIIFGLKTPSFLIEEIRTKVTAANPRISYKKVVRNSLTFNRELINI